MGIKNIVDNTPVNGELNIDLESAMSQLSMDPFNLDLLILTKELVRNFKFITNLSVFSPSSNNFHPDGLFSTDIFGPVGSDNRNNTFGLLDLKIPIYHPKIYEIIIKLKSVYKDIIFGKKYAIFNNDTGEYEIVAGPDDGGETGFNFFFKNLDKLKLDNNDSVERDFKIKILKKYKKEDLLMDILLVIPAGLREYIVDKSGQPSEDEVNGLYRKVLSLSLALNNINVDKTDPYILDPLRLKIQEAVYEIYKYFFSLLSGKNKFINGNWAKRSIMYGTRNVITALPKKVKKLDFEKENDFNTTYIGLYQYAKGISDIAKNKLLTKFISTIIDSTTGESLLVDPNTLKSKLVKVKPKYVTEFTTEEGLENLINKLSQDVIKDSPVLVDKYYLFLIYDNGDEIRYIRNTDDLNGKDIDMKKVRPVTIGELIYIAIADTVGKFKALLTRYPVAGLGGVYPTIPYLKTTLSSREVKYYHYFNSDSYELLREYPILNTKWMNSLSPDMSHLPRLGGDFDGDKTNFTILVTDEAIDEVDKVLNSVSYYVDTNGNITYTMETDYNKYLLKHLTDTAPLENN